MNNIVIIGCGIIGATLAYELSLIEGLKITVIDKQTPAQEATGAALGVLMGIISHKVKGKAWRMRQTSIQRYETLIPELEAITKRKIPFNRQGILMLLPSPEVTTDDLAFWEKLRETRQNQGWELNILDKSQLGKMCPQVDMTGREYIGAIHSPQDRQLDPTAFTLALVEAAKHNGVDFRFGVSALGMKSTSNQQNSSARELGTSNQQNSSARELGTSNQQNSSARELESSNQQNSSARELETSNQQNSIARELGTSNQQNSSARELETSNQQNSSARELETTSGVITADTFIICAGLGSSPLTEQLNQKVDIRPVLGQAIHLRLSHPLGKTKFQPAITCNDTYIVPRRPNVYPSTDYWVGATVEFTQENGEVVADKQLLETTLQSAIATCPELAKAQIVDTWSGLRPRPEGRPAPVIEKLPGYDNVILASAHYRNGVLLAPATAEMVKGMVLEG
ncbi:FAD dependent oxidoreductase [Calothrix parasitica NIES-267]|uniref:FAD dependent oxidoreductase n=1 Tax=Calothrix parasitica NIES-267 TaxID=1973488 RepID=A0A1Z4LWP6_9CYAN|nr:FAD dependent oxidoreductase [Calothrix parasitica NIES-267]